MCAGASGAAARTRMRPNAAEGGADTASADGSGAVQGAELVPVRVPHISQVHRTQLAFAQTRWVFDGDAAMGHGGVMELLELLGRTALEAQGEAIGRRGRLAVDGLTETEGAAVVPVEQAGLAGGVHI